MLTVAPGEQFAAVTLASIPAETGTTLWTTKSTRVRLSHTRWSTQQPLGGKRAFGGQRFGESGGPGLWECFGAAYTLQEMPDC